MNLFVVSLLFVKKEMSEEYEEDAGGDEESGKTPNVLLLESDSESSSDSDEDAGDAGRAGRGKKGAAAASTPLLKSASGGKSAPGSASRKKDGKAPPNPAPSSPAPSAAAHGSASAADAADAAKRETEKQLRAERRRKEHAEVAVPYV